MKDEEIGYGWCRFLLFLKSVSNKFRHERRAIRFDYFNRIALLMNFQKSHCITSLSINFFEVRIVISLDCPPVLEVVSSFVVFNLSYKSEDVNKKLEKRIKSSKKSVK